MPEFSSECYPIDVTSLHRPDTGWIVTDASGHEHRWYVGDKPAGAYNPSEKYVTPTLIWVKDGETYYEDDDEPHDVGHYECGFCGEHIERRFTADTSVQQIQGLRLFYIDGLSVSREEFERRLAEAKSADEAPSS